MDVMMDPVMDLAIDAVAHAGRIAWDEMLLIAVLAVPLLVGISYVVSRVLRSNR